MTPNKGQKVPAYRTRLKSERSDRLYVQIMEELTRDKRYRDPKFSTRQLAELLHTNTRYISAAVANCTGGNYNALVNKFRLRDACQMLRSVRHTHLTAEEIGLLSGFSSRQAFYQAFARVYDMTPRAYRQSNLQPAEN